MMFSQIHVISLIAKLILVGKICECTEWIPLHPKGSNKANNFGYSVAIEDNIIVVGELSSRAAYVFEQDSINGNWIQTANLFALQDTKDNDDDYLGTNVDVSRALGKDRVIIGARGSESSFVFEKNANTGIWQQVSKLVSNSNVNDEDCGNSVAIYGDYAITGCYSLSGSSRIEIFKNVNINNSNDWINIQTLFEVGNVDYYGYDVSMYDRYLIVGTRSETGKTYIYERRENAEDWYLMNEMTLFSNISGVDICKDFAIVGASDSGVAYILKRDSASGGWNQISTLRVDDSTAATNNYFGGSVSLVCPTDDETEYYVVIRLGNSDEYDNLYLFKMNETDNTVWDKVRSFSLGVNHNESLFAMDGSNNCLVATSGVPNTNGTSADAEEEVAYVMCDVWSEETGETISMSPVSARNSRRLAQTTTCEQVGQDDTYCYYGVYCSTAVNFSVAESYCNDNYGTTLASIEASSENTAAHNTVGYVKAWMGLTWPDTADNWEWLDGTEFSFSNWAGSDGQDNDQDCGIIGYSNTHQWLDQECDDVYHYLICNSDCHVPTTIPTVNPTPPTLNPSLSPTTLPTAPSLSPSSQPTLEPTTNCEQIGHDADYCYFGVYCINSVNFSVAESYCNDNYGTTLASIETSSENTAAHNTVGYVKAWMGLTWPDTADNWEWLDGTEFSFSNWAGSDGQDNDQDCGIIGYSNTHQWLDQECDDVYNYLICNSDCHVPTFIPTLNPTPPTLNPSLSPTALPTVPSVSPSSQPTLEPTTNCEQIGHDADYCYFGVYCINSVNFSTAESYCNDNYGTTLASIETSSENTAAHNTVGNVQAWMGLTWPDTADNWEWLDGTEFSFSNWAGSDGQDNDQDCGIIGYSNTHQWLDQECYDKYNYLICNEDCHVPTTIPTVNPTPETSSPSISPTALPTNPSTSPTTIPTQEPTANCEQIGYDDTYCIYGVECINAINQSVAESYCKNYYGTTLASIHSSTENNAGHNTVGGNVAAWIGLSWSSNTSEWTWTDGTDFNYYTWIGADGSGGNEACGVIRGNTDDKWSDRECSEEFYYFLCNEADCHTLTSYPTSEPTAPSLIPSIIPTSTPTSNCEEIGVDESYCYYGVECYHEVNQSEAQTYCENVYNTELASIHSSTENNAAHNTVGGSVAAWIGLSWSSNTSEWTWIDGTDFDYETWVGADGSGGDEACGVIRGNADDEWSDRRCSEEFYYFICNYDCPAPTSYPTFAPSLPTEEPTAPSFMPSSTPTSYPSLVPTSINPTQLPTEVTPCPIPETRTCNDTESYSNYGELTPHNDSIDGFVTATLINSTNNEISNSQWRCTMPSSGDQMCMYLNITDKCECESVITIGVYGSRLSGTDADVFSVFSFSDASSGTDKFVSFLSDWNGHVSDGAGNDGGVFMAPGCGDELYSIDDIFTLIDDPDLYLGSIIRNEPAGGDLNNYELVTNTSVGAGATFYLYMINDRVSDTSSLYFSSGTITQLVGCDNLGNAFEFGENIILNLFPDQGKIGFDKFTVDFQCNTKSTLSPTLIPTTSTTSDEMSNCNASMDNITLTPENFRSDLATAYWNETSGGVYIDNENGWRCEQNVSGEYNLCMYLEIEDNCDCISTTNIMLATEGVDLTDDADGPHIIGAVSYKNSEGKDVWFGVASDLYVHLTINGVDGGTFLSPHCSSNSSSGDYYTTDNIFDLYGTSNDPRVTFGNGSEETWEKITSSNDHARWIQPIFFQFVNNKMDDTFKIGYYSEQVGYWSYCTYDNAFYPIDNKIVFSYLNPRGSVRISNITMDYECDTHLPTTTTSDYFDYFSANVNYTVSTTNESSSSISRRLLKLNHEPFGSTNGTRAILNIVSQVLENKFPYLQASDFNVHEQSPPSNQRRLLQAYNDDYDNSVKISIEMPQIPTQRHRIGSIDDMENKLYSTISETQELLRNYFNESIFITNVVINVNEIGGYVVNPSSVDPLAGNTGNENEEIDVILILVIAICGSAALLGGIFGFVWYKKKTPSGYVASPDGETEDNKYEFPCDDKSNVKIAETIEIVGVDDKTGDEGEKSSV